MLATRPTGASAGARPASRSSKRVWLFDLDNTLHDASHAAFGQTNLAMNEYMVSHLDIDPAEAARLRQHYWHHYGATLLGLVRHHGVKAGHFLEQTHLHPGLEDRLRTSAHDRAALKRLRGRKFIVTNAPLNYTMRVLSTLKLAGCFDGVISIEDMSMFGQLRPKPDARMFRHLVARLKVRPIDCVLVEDVLENQKAARGIGMRTAWMQRYLEGRFQGHLRFGPGGGSNNGSRPREVGVHPCPSPRYVCAKIKSLQKLLTLG
jgi:putative hydrolase of the HAD superfamily